jgi:hypothetical protein
MPGSHVVEEVIGVDASRGLLVFRRRIVGKRKASSFQTGLEQSLEYFFRRSCISNKLYRDGIVDRLFSGDMLFQYGRDLVYQQGELAADIFCADALEQFPCYEERCQFFR